IPTIISVPDPAEAASQYLDTWAVFDYPLMYSQLTKLSTDSTSFQEFEARYKDITLTASLVGLDYEILQVLTNPTTAQVAYAVTLNSALVGEISRETRMNLSLEGGAWRVVWDETIIIPDLAGGNQLSMQRFTPTRGIIYDRNGDALASDTDAYAVQVIPSAVEEEDSNGLLSQLSVLLNLNPRFIEQEIFDEDAPFLVPLGVVSADQFDQRSPFLDDFFDFLRLDQYFTRLYHAEFGGANAIGYTGQIGENEVDDYIKLGYPIDAVVGKQGLESWGENYLSGTRGGELYVIGPEGNLITLLAKREAQPSNSIYSTLDLTLQREAQLAIQGFTGAIVVMERDTGKILSMVSSPTFDPNSADFGNPISEWNSYFPDEGGRFFNRATQGQYPPGSIFKVITLAAALESERWTPQSSYLCGHAWSDLGIDLFDWTLAHGEAASGELSLLEGLMRSCNPWFYNIGKTLYDKGDVNLLAEMARSFGLGQPTGLEELPEEAGQITDPEASTTGSTPVFNAVQQAIGQSDTFITPLQAVVYTAAVGNGGSLFKPQLVERIVDVNGESVVEFEPVVNST
ncbi:MAG: penicillin-binding transpeptidase domain-containing protein, partial [Chloroflexota bacterium]